MSGQLSVYSPRENVIYSKLLFNDYKTAGTWPDDGIEITDDDAIKFSPVNQPNGYKLGFSNGELFWDEIKITKEELVSIADDKKKQLLHSAKEKISIWQTKLQLGRITDDEKKQLNVWIDYIDDVSAVDTSTAPDINWPQQPAE